MAELVSIVIPVYNAIPYLEECLASVKAQTYPHLEVILINDGSTDNSEELLRDYANKNPQFHLYNQTNHGLGYTRNRGMSLSSGKYLFFLDADDSIPPNAIASLVSAAEKSGADYAVGKVVRFNAVRKYIPIRHLEFGLYEEKGLTTLADNPAMVQDSIACNKLWKKALLVDNDLLFIEGKYYEDLALTLKAAVLAEKIEVINEVVYNWRVRDDEDKPSITQQQMKLDNTLHRIEALQDNRDWLIKRSADAKIIEENDLKSLLDIIRLHAIKFALIDEKDREEWEKSVLAFLHEVPPAVARRLPGKEKIIYDLLMDHDFVNLELFSKMLVYAEQEKLVIQKSGRFVFQGHGKEYDVTPFFKPELVIEQVKRNGSSWTLEGKLEVPKASNPVAGCFYAKERNSGREIVIEEASAIQSSQPGVYPFEKQDFTAVVEAAPFLAFSKKAAFDFYYRLPEYPDSSPARVRLPFISLQNEELQRTGAKLLKIYGTNYGNLSMKRENSKIKAWLKKYLPI